MMVCLCEETYETIKAAAGRKGRAQEKSPKGLTKQHFLLPATVCDNTQDITNQKTP